MKQVHATYSFVASTKTITLTGLNIDQDQLLLIVNATRGVQYFNFADSSLRATVTAGTNTTVVLTDASTTGHANGDALVIYYDDQVTSQVVSGTVTANPGTGAFTVSGTVGLDNASLVALENITVTVGSSMALAAGSEQIGSVTVANFPATQTIAGTVTVGSLPAISGSVTVNNFPSSQTISGTVTANVGNSVSVGELPSRITRVIGSTDAVRSVLVFQDSTGGISELSALTNRMPISGTVTANLAAVGANSVTSPSSSILMGYRNATNIQTPVDPSNPLPVSFQGVQGQVGIEPSAPPRALQIGYYNSAESVWVGVDRDYPLPVRAEVSQLPKVTLLDGSGSVTTANSAITVFASSTTRSYLLVQVTTGSAFVNVGASATTLNGINLTAGQGYAWETTIPQGIVSLISTVTNSRYVAKQA